MEKQSHNKSFVGGALSNITTYQAGVAQAHAHRILQKVSDEALLPYGVSKMQWLIIGTVLDAGENGIRLTDLAEIMGTKLPYITNMVNLLESKGMLSRQDSDSDGRSKFIVIDDGFAPMCTKIEHALRDALRRSIYAHIDQDEFKIYMKVMYQLSELG